MVAHGASSCSGNNTWVKTRLNEGVIPLFESIRFKQRETDIDKGVSKNSQAMSLSSQNSPQGPKKCVVCARRLMWFVSKSINLPCWLRCNLLDPSSCVQRRSARWCSCELLLTDCIIYKPKGLLHDQHVYTSLKGLLHVSYKSLKDCCMYWQEPKRMSVCIMHDMSMCWYIGYAGCTYQGCPDLRWLTSGELLCVLPATTGECNA
jgi:hypothetical protein